MSFPYFISPEQAMRERSELARKGIARGRSVVALAYAGGVLFVAENPSRSLQKVSEIYDRVGFAAVGRFNEFDNLRRGGIQYADTRGYAYDRRDVSGRQLANVYAQTLGTIFTEQAKPYEVELCVAEVAHYGETKPPELYRITYDGSIADEPHFVVMGGTTDPIITALNESYPRTPNCRGGQDRRRRPAGGINGSAGNATPPAEPRVPGPPHSRWPSSTRTGRGARSGGSPARRWRPVAEGPSASADAAAGDDPDSSVAATPAAVCALGIASLSRTAPTDLLRGRRRRCARWSAAAA